MRRQKSGDCGGAARGEREKRELLKLLFLF